MKEVENKQLVRELNNDEAITINGGLVWMAVAAAIGGYIISEWPDIKKGIRDGWNEN